jgi:Fic family protein
MTRRELYDDILNLLRQRAEAGQGELTRGQIAQAMGAPGATLSRYLASLLRDGRIERHGQTTASYYRLRSANRDAIGCGLTSSAGEASLADSPVWSGAARALLTELNAPLGVRLPISYQRRFLDAYVPNRTFLLPEALANELVREAGMQGRLPAGTYARTVIEPFLLDLSFFSSRLEGNRFSGHEARVLFASSAADPLDRDATMLLNHRDAILFLVDHVPLYGMTGTVIRNLHTLLMQGLLREIALGTIREEGVRISHSGYVPSHVPSLLGEMFDQLVQKAHCIRNPVEAASFLWVNLAYLQPFEDGNKRTSRLGANIPLLLFNCAPLSFADVSIEDYAHAMLGVYERLDVSVAAELFAWTYLDSVKQDVRFTDNHLGRSAEVIAAG